MCAVGVDEAEYKAPLAILPFLAKVFEHRSLSVCGEAQATQTPACLNPRAQTTQL